MKKLKKIPGEDQLNKVHWLTWQPLKSLSCNGQNCNMFDPKAAIFKAWHFLGSHLYVSGYLDICLSRYLSLFYSNMSQMCFKYYDSVFLIVGVLWFSWFWSVCRRRRLILHCSVATETTWPNIHMWELSHEVPTSAWQKVQTLMLKCVTVWDFENWVSQCFVLHVKLWS